LWLTLKSSKGEILINIYNLKTPVSDVRVSFRSLENKELTVYVHTYKDGYDILTLMLNRHSKGYAPKLTKIDYKAEAAMPDTPDEPFTLLLGVGSEKDYNSIQENLDHIVNIKQLKNRVVIDA